MIWANRPVPLWIVSSASGSTEEPVRINCDGSQRLSTSLRMESQIGGKACHSSIRRGVAPLRSDFGLISIICELCFNTDASPRSSTLFASCLAVVVLPHHFGPSINTAPFPRTLRSRILSAIRFLYSAISFCFGYKSTTFVSINQRKYRLFGDLRKICSVIWGNSVRLFVKDLFGYLWKWSSLCSSK